MFTFLHALSLSLSLFVWCMYVDKVQSSVKHMGRKFQRERCFWFAYSLGDDAMRACVCVALVSWARERQLIQPSEMKNSRRVKQKQAAQLFRHTINQENIRKARIILFRFILLVVVFFRSLRIEVLAFFNACFVSFFYYPFPFLRFL